MRAASQSATVKKAQGACAGGQSDACLNSEVVNCGVLGSARSLLTQWSMRISGEQKLRVRTLIEALGTAGAVVVALCFFFYPGVMLVKLAHDPGIQRDGQPADFHLGFQRTAQRFRAWAEDYLESRRAESTLAADVAGTEWPLFGTVFFLLSAEELIKQGKIQRNEELMSAMSLALKVVMDPSTATWVRQKWGDNYKNQGNVFYRMLVLHGLTSYERATLDQRYRAVQEDQARRLADELMAAPHKLADDYPGECYPTDVLWAVAAIQRALGEAAAPLVADIMRVLDTRFRTKHGVPAFSVDSKSGEIYQGSRGSGNSGILCLAGELDPELAQGWYDSYAKHHWKDGVLSGFREVPLGDPAVMDVDSGPVVLGIGSVASLFGIGAARANGRFDHASKLTQQVLAVSWPTPFGLLVPGAMGWLAADGWCFGELALSFAMTRPTYAAVTRPHDGAVPELVWVMCAFYFGVGGLILARELVFWRKRWVNR